MPRLLSDEIKSIKGKDTATESMFTLFYRPPTVEERISYANSFVTRKGNKIETSLGETRINNGLKIMTGFDDNAFLKKDSQGNKVPLSSDPKSKNYDPKWKEIVRQYASDVAAWLAMQVFEAGLLKVEDTNEDPT
ncbi:MAG: hypothetical protein ABSC54_00865 [Smithellaceae bacterium]|jgi:hypothetical protein